MNELDKTITAVCIKHALFGKLVIQLQAHYDATVPTACVGPQGIGVSPTFHDPLPLPARMGLLAHECGHAMLGHLDRLDYYLKTAIGPDGQPFNARQYNVACDYVVNKMVTECGFTLPDGALFDHHLQDGVMPEQLYVAHRQDKGSKSGSGKGKPRPKDKDGNDIHSPDLDAKNPLDEHRPTPAPDEQDSNSLENPPIRLDPIDIVEAASLAGKMGQPIPEALRRVIDTIRHPTANPWTILRRFMLASIGPREQRSWRRLNRRYIVRGIGAPGRTPVGCPHIGIVVDTSGSIDRKMLSLFAGHITLIASTAKPKKITLVWCDGSVRRVDTVTHPRQLVDCFANPPDGGGGTDMTQGVKALRDAGCEIGVCLTDGYTPFGRAADFSGDFVWAMTTDTKAPWGQTINIRERDE